MEVPLKNLFLMASAVPPPHNLLALQLNIYIYIFAASLSNYLIKVLCTKTVKQETLF